jgi:maleylpyruvate isomerase
MTSPTPDLPSLHASTDALLQDLAEQRWTDADVGVPSLLPGWTRGHVLTHLARNADGITRTLSGALRGQRLARYPDGPQGRAADIEHGAGRPLAEQLRDVRDSAERLEQTLAAVADVDGWALPCHEHTAGAHVLGRWQEVEIHRVDLAGSYTARDWPANFIGYLLPATVGGLDARIPAGHAVRIEVDPEGSVAPELAGTVWSCGNGSEPAAVTGPDWALLAWVLGRPAATGGALSSQPELHSWR